MIRTWLFASLALICLSAVGCSSSSNSALVPQGPAGEIEPIQTDPGISLGSLDSLPAPTHAVSMEGPGWYDIQVNTHIARSGVVTPHPIGELPLAAVASPAFAMFGVMGFDGDNGPTSARISAAVNSGEYYVGFSDYISGNWVFSGPFTGSATVEIPNPDNHISPAAFTSENGHCYISVVVPSEGSLTLTKVELGVHGGVLGPAPPPMSSLFTSDEGIQFIWASSPNASDPDFAGYVVDRAPQFHGDFERLHTHPIQNNYYVDDTAVVGTPYRYMLRSIDVSGNISIGHSLNMVMDPASSLAPNPHVSLPPGPLFGPRIVAFDMTASNDPEGDPIDDYTIAFWGDIPDASGPEPVKLVVLQPGCYTFNASVTAGGRTATFLGSVKVYPQWNDPVVVKDSTPSNGHGVWLTSGVIPGTDRLIHGTTNPYTNHFTVMIEDGLGGLEMQNSYRPDAAMVAQDPLAFHNELLFMVESNSNIQISACNGERTKGLYGMGKYDQAVAGFASDGTDRVWVVICRDDGANYHLRAYDTGDPFSAYDIVPNSGDINWISAKYNPVVDALDIVYVTDLTNALYWVRDNLDGLPAVPIEIHPGTIASYPTIEVNPSNGRPLVAYYNSPLNRVVFSALTSDLTTWTPAEFIDNSTNNTIVHDLVLDDGYPYILLGLDDGTLNLYRRGASWNKTNTVTDTNTTVTFCTLTKIPGDDGLVITYRDMLHQLNSVHAAPDGTNTLRWTIPGIEPLGAELHGAAGTDGLHVIFRNFGGDMSHLISSDGETWNPEAAPAGPAENMDIVAGKDGEIYVSYFQVPDAKLDWWTGGGFVPVATVSTDVLHRPILTNSLTSNTIRFGCFDTGAGVMAYVHCEHGLVHSATGVVMDDVWGGVFSNSSNNTVMVAGGLVPTSGMVYKASWNNDVIAPIYFGGGSTIMSDDLFVEGKSMEHASFRTHEIFGGGDAFWTTSGLRNEPMRIEYSAFGESSLTTIDMPFEGVLEPRRTITAIDTPSYTAVALISDLNGDMTHFEWSDYGNWETLPLPRGIENMMSPELLCGTDGRWHLVYRDWVTDDLMCVSTKTLAPI